MKLNKTHAALGLLLAVVLSTTLWIGTNALLSNRALHSQESGESEIARRSTSLEVSQTNQKPALRPAETRISSPQKTDREIARDERIVRIAKYVEQIYGKPVAGLDWSDAEKVKLIEFLVDRYEARYIAHGVVSEMPNTNVADFARMAAFAETDVDHEMLAYFGEQKFQQIQSMLELNGYLNKIVEHFEPAFTQAGTPLSPKQVIPLAEIFRDIYGPSGNAATLPTRKRVNPDSSLTDFDLVVLERAAAILQPRQVVALRSAIVSRNQDYLSRN